MPDSTVNPDGRNVSSAIPAKVPDAPREVTVVGVATVTSAPPAISAEPSISAFFVINAATTTTPTLLSPTANKKVMGWALSNSGSAFRYLKLYNKASAPNPATDVPVLTIGVLSGASVNVSLRNGILFPLGIASAITTGGAQNDTGATLTATELVGQVFAS